MKTRKTLNIGTLYAVHSMGTLAYISPNIHLFHSLCKLRYLKVLEWCDLSNKNIKTKCIT